MYKIVLYLFICSSLIANTDDINELFELSLEELMDVEVSTVSQKMEKASKSSAVISVITDKQIQEWGVHNVYEALSFLPGVNINETYMGYSVVTFRGVTPGLYNTKVLFMINGHPVHERLFGSSHAEYVPLEVIKRIEVVRSPASVLYGSNAISGVVNIITKRDKDKSQVTLRGGSYNHYYGSTSIQVEGYTFAGSIKRDSGYDYSGTLDELGSAVNFDYFENIENFFADIYGDTWYIQASYFNLDEQKFGATPNIFHNGANYQKSFYLDINKNFKVGSGELDIWLRYDNFDKKIFLSHFPLPTDSEVNAFNTVDRYSMKLQYNQKLDSGFSYIAGLDYELDYSTPFLFIDTSTGAILTNQSPYTKNQNFSTLAGYLQLDYTVYDKLESVVGFRMEKNSDYGLSKLFPHFGLTYEVDKNQYFKLLYSEAFRTPNYLEKYSDIPIVHGDKNLNPENIKTVDLSYEAQLNEKASLSITLFYLILDDEIFRDSNQQYVNTKGRDVYGLEMQYYSLINDDFELMFNASYLDGKENQSQEDLKYIANYTLNLVATYKIIKGLKLTISDQQVGAKDYQLTNLQEGEIASYNIANIMLKYSRNDSSIMFQIKNLFDVEYNYPEQVRQNIPALPGGAGRSFYITYRYKF